MAGKCTLVIDARERHVTRHAHELANVNKVIKQITIGDYAVLNPAGAIMATIERKSLEDYAASIKDGRHSNKSKLINLREKTGCRIVYIIEGSEFPRPTDYFGNIQYSYIESSIFHLIVGDGISVIRTKDSLETAKMLCRFMYSMDTLVTQKHARGSFSAVDLSDTSASSIDAPAIVSASIPAKSTSIATNVLSTELVSEASVEMKAAPIVQNITIESTALVMSPQTQENTQQLAAQSDNTPEIANNAIELLTQSMAKTTHEIVQSMWAKFAGISTESASEYMRCWSLADVISGKITRAEILNYKMSNGRKIGKKASASLTGITRLVERKLLATIPGMSVAAAEMLTTNHSLRDLLSWGVGGLEMCIVSAAKLKKNGTMGQPRRLGRALAEKIILHFNYKVTAQIVVNSPAISSAHAI